MLLFGNDDKYSKEMNDVIMIQGSNGLKATFFFRLTMAIIDQIVNQYFAELKSQLLILVCKCSYRYNTT